ncbi:MAG: undecaprenyl-diphosphate phosphatase [Chloroflexia bacterium]|nr:undecaprenyl-diphosphate phosphatase [Chloroflexia bacterium]MDQ3514576.1 UDP-diphosphatase [Chloroflexota bacterium]
MSILQAIVLGIVQGLTEFLPISSSAHLSIVPWLLGWDEPGLAFDAALHLGTLTAVFTYFWRDLFGMARALPPALPRAIPLLRDPSPAFPHPASTGDQQARLALLIGVGTVPGLLAGYFGESTLEGFFHGDDGQQSRAILVSAVLLIAVGLLLWVAERVAAHHRTLTHLTWRDAVTIGLAQATALVPGVSRSGATLIAGLFIGLSRPEALRFSFLLGTPLILGAGLKSVLDTVQNGMSGTEVTTFLVGGITSALVGFAAIAGLLRFVRTSTFSVFVIYRIALGLSLLVLLAVGFR